MNENTGTHSSHEPLAPAPPRVPAGIHWVGLWTLIVREVKRMLRVAVQTLLTPWITATLYVFIFGSVVGSRIGTIAGVPYIDFVIPGIVMMNVIMSSFMHSSSSLFMMRFQRSIDELLVAPLSHLEMVIGFAVGGIVRGTLVGLGVYTLALLFTGASIANFGLFLAYMIAIATIFSLIGMAMGVISGHFEHLTILNTFVITPFVFLGGVFNSIAMFPPVVQTLVHFNPFFYFVDGLRYTMLGISESNLAIGAAVIAGIGAIALGAVWAIFATGWRIRE